jgi:Putative metal-binding motif
MPKSRALIALTVTVVLAGCGGSSNSPFSPHRDAGGGTGGSAGGGTGGTSGSAGTGGSATGGSSGSGGTSGSAGAAGAGGCDPASCDDGITCTVDTCGPNGCVHTAGPDTGPTACPTGQFCQVGKGCVQGQACATTQQCVDALGGDACKTNIQCDPATDVCTWQVLDKDGDGHAPAICGGDDCDDSDPTVYPGAPEICDGKDNDCNGKIDDGKNLCPGLAVCTQGACTCAAANTCGADCVDKQTDNANCGTCFNACPSGATCKSGQCVCNATATLCNGLCVDTTSDSNNCSACNHACPNGSTCHQSACVCQSGLTMCGGQCVDTQTDLTNCGGCNKPCSGECQNGQCIACTAADLYFLTDTTGSMADDASGGTGTPTRLQFEESGIEAFMAEPASNGLGVGMGFFPVEVTATTCTTDADCGGAVGSCFAGTCLAGDSCVASDYTTPSVAIQPLPGVAAAITAALTPQVAGGATPPEILQGALTYAKTHEQQNPTHKTAVVMIADGLPNECATTSDDPGSLTPIATSFATGTPPIKTFVVAISNDEPAASWNEVAAAGGTGTAHITLSASDITTALESIRTQFKTCP